MFSQCINKLREISEALPKDEKDKLGANLFKLIPLVFDLFKYGFVLNRKFENGKISYEEAYFLFINKFDAALLKIGIDVRSLQEQTGIEIKNINRFEITTRAKDLALFFDNNEDLALYYIEQAEENEIRVNFNDTLGKNVVVAKEEKESPLLNGFWERIQKKSISRDKRFEKYFGNMLDAFLLKRGINLKVIQDNTLIQIEPKEHYEKSKRIKETAQYLGGEKMAKHYLESLSEVHTRHITTTHKKENNGRDRAKPFIEILNETNKEQRLKALHKVLKGCKGKQVVIYLKACLELGWLKEKPTFVPVKKEFGNIGNCSGFNKYMSEKFDDDEMKAATSALNDALNNVQS